MTRMLDNAEVLHKVQEIKTQLYEKYLSNGIPEKEKKERREIIEMGINMMQLILLEYTVPYSQQLNENTELIKKFIKVASSAIALLFTTIVAAIVQGYFSA